MHITAFEYWYPMYYRRCGLKNSSGYQYVVKGSNGTNNNRIIIEQTRGNNRRKGINNFWCVLINEFVGNSADSEDCVKL